MTDDNAMHSIHAKLVLDRITPDVAFANEQSELLLACRTFSKWLKVRRVSTSIGAAVKQELGADLKARRTYFHSLFAIKLVQLAVGNDVYIDHVSRFL